MSNPFQGFVLTKPNATKSKKSSNPFEGFTIQKPISQTHRAAGEFGSSALGTYGDIAEFTGIQGANRPSTLPGEQARYERESRATPEELIRDIDIEEFPSYAKLPTKRELQGQFGVTEPVTKEEKRISKIASGAGSGLALGGPSAIVPSATGSMVGQSAREMGAPEWIATPLDIGTSIAFSGVPSPSKSVETMKKPSGLTTRQFEKVTTPTKISPERFAKITQTVEGEAKELIENLLKPEQTYRSMKEIPDFYGKLDKAFNQVEELAKTIPEKIKGQGVVDSFTKKVRERLTVPVKRGQYERAYQKEAQRLLKDVNRGEITVYDLFKDYRKNNKEYGKLYAPGKSSLQNDAAKDVLMDWNRSISESFEKLPQKEFSNMFKFTNNVNSKVKDIETITNFFDKSLSNKFDYKNIRKVFEKNKVSDAIQRTYGKKSLDKFEQLATDLLSQEQGMRLLKTAKSAGVDLGDVGAYLINPKLAALKKSGKLFNYAKNSLLDKPEVMINWIDALKFAKKGAFVKSRDLLEKVDDALTQTNQEK